MNTQTPETSNTPLVFQPSDPAAARTLSGEQIRHYNAEGYVSGLTALDGGEARDFRSYIDDLLGQVVSAGDGRNSYSVNLYHVRCRGLWDIATHPRILDLVEDILGPNFVCWGTHLFAKMPHDGKEVPFHQDAVFWPLRPARTVTAWLAVDDVDAGNAAMQFVPGSHLDGELPHETIGLDDTRVLGRRALGLENRPERFVNELPSGHVSLHSDLLLHGSAANSSDRRRAGLTLRYAAADVRVLDGFEHWRQTSIHCRAGGLTGYWESYPRPEGEHPEEMARFWSDYGGRKVDAS